MDIYECACKYFDRIYEHHDVTIFDFQNWLHLYHKDGLITLQQMWDIAYALEERYPKRGITDPNVPAIVAPQRLNDGNDYELMAVYDGEF